MAEGYEQIFDIFGSAIEMGNGDANTIQKSGVYMLRNESTNTPTDLNSVNKYLIHIGIAGGIQICKPLYPWEQNYGVYMRQLYYDNNTIKFGLWKKISWAS